MLSIVIVKIKNKYFITFDFLVISVCHTIAYMTLKLVVYL